MRRVRDAAHYLAEADEAGSARFRGKGSAYVWKDSCVFVSDCDRGILLAHPTMPERDRLPLLVPPGLVLVLTAHRSSSRCRLPCRSRSYLGRPSRGPASAPLLDAVSGLAYVRRGHRS